MVGAHGQPKASNDIDAIIVMLDEIDAAWQKDQNHILEPKERPGFKVVSDNGVPRIVPNDPVPFAALVGRLQQRKQANNKHLSLYADSALVPSEVTPGKLPHVFALNDTLLVFVEPDPTDGSLVRYVAVALP